MEINKRSEDADLGQVQQKGKNNLITYIVIGAIAVWGLLFGILGLVKSPSALEESFSNKFEKNTVVEGYAEYGTNDYFLDYAHSINGITVAHEYYYIIMSEDMSSAVAVRAPKKFGKKFDENLEAKELVKIKGKVRTMKNDVRGALGSVISDAASKGIFVEQDNYVDLLSRRLNIFQIIIGAGNILILILLALSRKRTVIDGEVMPKSKGAAFAAIMTFFVCGILLLYVVMITL